MTYISAVVSLSNQLDLIQILVFKHFINELSKTFAHHTKHSLIWFSSDWVLCANIECICDEKTYTKWKHDFNQLRINGNSTNFNWFHCVKNKQPSLIQNVLTYFEISIHSNLFGNRLRLKWRNSDVVYHLKFKFSHLSSIKRVPSISCICKNSLLFDEWKLVNRFHTYTQNTWYAQHRNVSWMHTKFSNSKAGNLNNLSKVCQCNLFSAEMNWMGKTWTKGLFD